MELQQQLKQLQQQTTHVYQQPYVRCRHRSGKHFVITGALILTIGIIEFMSNFIGYFLRYNFVAYGSSGIWVGIILIITGSFGIAAGCKKNVKCFIIAYMVLCIISTVSDIAIVSQASIGVVVNAFGKYPRICSRYRRWSSPKYSIELEYIYKCRDVQAKLAFHMIMLLLGLAVGVIAIIGSVLSCKRSRSCCGYIEPTISEAYSGAQVPFGGGGGSGAQTIVLIPRLGQPTTIEGHPGQQFYQVQVGAQQQQQIQPLIYAVTGPPWYFASYYCGATVSGQYGLEGSGEPSKVSL